MQKNIREEKPPDLILPTGLIPLGLPTCGAQPLPLGVLLWVITAPLPVGRCRDVTTDSYPCSGEPRFGEPAGPSAQPPIQGPARNKTLNSIPCNAIGMVYLVTLDRKHKT